MFQVEMLLGFAHRLEVLIRTAELRPDGSTFVDFVITEEWPTIRICPRSCLLC